MHAGFPALLMALVVSQPPRDCFETANFVVYAEDVDTARKVGAAAESCRKELGKRWLRKDLEDWSSQCRIDVTIADRSGGVTEVSFADGKVQFPRVRVKGSLDRILKGPLPHELTHVLFAHHFGRQPPRWADEGGAILSESEAVAAKHREALRKIIDAQRQFPVRELLAMQHYPSDIPCLYSQGHSIAAFLVAAKGHAAFLTFVTDGLDRNWDSAVRDGYGYQDVEHLEKAWLDWASRKR